MKTSRMAAETLTGPLSTIERAPFSSIPPAKAARVKLCIVDNKSLVTRLDVAVFNSAP